MTIASLAMYPFTEVQPAYDKLWDGVRRRLSFEAPALDWDVAADVACRRPDLILGQTCGWPLITELRSIVTVVGTFDCDIAGGAEGTYRSVLVTGRSDTLVDILRSPDLRVVANSPDSLSGWISLQAVAAEHGVHLDNIDWSGAHAKSIEVLRDHRADLAAIDAVSWSHLDRTGLSVVGEGPRIPCLPLVTSGSSPAAVITELRGALADTVADPTMADVCATLRIRGFVDRQLADYEELSALAQLG